MELFRSLLPIEFFDGASNFQLGPFEDCGLTSDFEPDCELVKVGLLINLVHIGFDHRLGFMMVQLS